MSNCATHIMVDFVTYSPVQTPADLCGEDTHTSTCTMLLRQFYDNGKDFCIRDVDLCDSTKTTAV